MNRPLCAKSDEYLPPSITFVRTMCRVGPLPRTLLSFPFEHSFALTVSMDTNLHEERVVLSDDDLPDLTQILRLHILQVVQGCFITKHL